MVQPQIKVKRVTPGYANFQKLFPELNYWPDETLIPVDHGDARTEDKAAAKRAEIKVRNMRQFWSGGFIDVKPNQRFPEYGTRGERRRAKHGKS
jgi:hypothetical protein